MEFQKLTDAEEAIGKLIVDAAFKVHSTLGPGLLERIYEVCLVHELRKSGLTVNQQVNIPMMELYLKRDCDWIFWSTIK